MTVSKTCRQRLEEYLRERGIAYTFQHHPLAYTARGVAASEHVPANEMAKTVIVMADGKQVMIVVPATHELQMNELARAIGAHDARLADEREFGPTFPDCEIGAMPPFGNLYGLTVYVDESLSDDETILFQAGTHTDTMRINYADFVRLVNPKIAEVAVRRYVPTVLV
jgi:Ala-tRNA(Pro) deacylase